MGSSSCRSGGGILHDPGGDGETSCEPPQKNPEHDGKHQQGSQLTRRSSHLQLLSHIHVSTRPADEPPPAVIRRTHPQIRDTRRTQVRGDIFRNLFPPPLEVSADVAHNSPSRSVGVGSWSVRKTLYTPCGVIPTWRAISATDSPWW